MAKSVGVWGEVFGYRFSKCSEFAALVRHAVNVGHARICSGNLRWVVPHFFVNAQALLNAIRLLPVLTYTFSRLLSNNY